MDTDWDWKSKNNLLKKGGEKNELWRIWWAICTTRITGKT